MVQLKPFIIMADLFILMADSFILMNTMDMARFFVGYHLDLFASCYDTVSR